MIKALFKKFFTPESFSSRHTRIDAAIIGVKVATISVTEDYPLEA